MSSSSEIDAELEISSSELHSLFQTGESPLLLDVQDGDDFEAWNILNSKNIPLAKLLELEELSLEFSSRQIVTICPSGNKSRKAAKFLRNKGYSVMSLHGGIREWNTVFDTVNIDVSDSDLEIIQFRRIAKGCLSYLISLNGEAAIIDPTYKTDTYLEVIEEKGLVLKYIFDTHLQADHISGSRLLEVATGAKMYLSDKDPFKFEFNSLNKNESFKLGGQNVITAIHSPGHTKGSTIYRIKDLGVLSGDTVFVDGIGRPDLADRSAEFANDLYDTIQNNIMTLPRDMFIAPSHHGKFAIEHFHSPLITDVKSVENNNIVSLDKQDFVEYSVNFTNSFSRPPSYQTIMNINTGDEEATNLEIISLEAGPNRCAID